MTIEQFFAVIATRIPTPAEFVAFAESHWRIGLKPDGTGVLGGDKNDPLIQAFARMLSREPYRTNVVALLKAHGPKEDRPAARPDPEPEQEPESCRVCQRDVSNPEDRERLGGVNPFCVRGAARPTTDANGVTHEAQAPCPSRTG